MIKKNQENNTLRQSFQCHKELKCIVKSFHKKCCPRESRKKAAQISGKDLNEWLYHYRGIQTKPFKNSHKLNYTICNNLVKVMEKDLMKIPSLINTDICHPVASTTKAPQKKKKNTPTLANAPVPALSREQRSFMRNRIPVQSLDGIKNVKVTIDKDDDYDIEIKDEKKKMSYSDKFKSEILDEFYKLPFGKLTMRQRRLRMQSLSKLVLSACIDRNEYKNRADGYLHFNKPLAIDIMNLLDGIKECLEKKLKITFNAIEEEVRPPIHNDRDGLIINLNDKKAEHRLAIALMGETTATGYARVKKDLLEHEIDVPSMYIMAKDRPKVTPITFDVMKHHNDESDADCLDNDNIIVCPEVHNNRDGGTMNTVPTQISEDAILEDALRYTSKVKEKMEGAKLEGTYKEYVEKMEITHEKKGNIIGNEPVIILDSIDGAEHLRSKNKITSVISFSSSMITGKWVNDHAVTAGSSLNIMTWQQVNGTESLHTMIPAVEEYLKVKKSVRADPTRRNYHYYDLHDGKMLYLLTQHSLWNRKFNPFLLCTCSRGIGVTSPDTHTCVPLSHVEQITAWNRSLRRWNNKTVCQKSHQSQQRNAGTYTFSEHMTWIDENNQGVSHFGLHPDLFPRDSIRFDTFHMKCAVTRKLMTYVRNLILEQTDDCMELFLSTVLKKFYNDFHLFVWKHKKSFSSFQGNELALFVGHISLIKEFLISNLVATPIVQDITDSLTLWVSIFKFLGITCIEEGEEGEYLNRIDQFNIELKELYSKGLNTFLSKPGKPGIEETFYCHALRYYMPRIAKVTYETHGTGVGIFNMQGFERRNKESKNCMKRFSNNKGNMLVNNMRRIWDIYEHGKNCY
jgi:hypothetical protein